ncbi:alpha/beta hydrolase [Fulvivirga ligni]|uniref:alpha/beta hydrolase n=1 Tax=Fulvivirga ligni TaxID=2904246 RepID=UPI001F195B81|nr:alpha/beta hydrolase [Fulvivirga ligni]UII21394.1 alpha/beta hydrolase [Fulvivirga ligni]
MRKLTYGVLCMILVMLSCEESHESYEPLPSFNQSSSSIENTDDEPISDANNSDKKTFLFVHGAWHPEGSWTKMVLGLEKLGHECHTVQLPALGTDKTPINQVTLAGHVAAVTNKMQEIGTGITLVGHSYGGVVISQAAENLSSYVDRVVYVSAFMLMDGEALLDFAIADVNSVVTQNIVVSGDSVFIPEDAYENAFYNYGQNSNNVNIDEDIYFTKSLLVPHPFITFATPVSLTSAYYNLDKVYISCTEDRAITLQAQVSMYSRFSDVDLYTIQGSDHSPFISRPKQMINILKGL